MTDRTERRGADEQANEHATDDVVASFKDAAPGTGEGRSPEASGEGELAEAARRATEAGGEDPSAG